jgi:hypothetical protein
MIDEAKMRTYVSYAYIVARHGDPKTLLRDRHPTDDKSTGGLWQKLKSLLRRRNR